MPTLVVSGRWYSVPLAHRLRNCRMWLMACVLHARMHACTHACMAPGYKAAIVLGSGSRASSVGRRQHSHTDRHMVLWHQTEVAVSSLTNLMSPFPLMALFAVKIDRWLDTGSKNINSLLLIVWTNECLHSCTHRPNARRQTKVENEQQQVSQRGPLCDYRSSQCDTHAETLPGHKLSRREDWKVAGVMTEKCARRESTCDHKESEKQS